MSSPLEYTPVDAIPSIHATLRAGFASGKLKSIPARRKQLLALAYLVQDNAQAFEDSLHKDLGRPALETRLVDIGASIHEALYAYNNVSTWAKPEKAPFSLNWGATSPVIRKEAKGVVCIIVPFNVPLWCLISPLAGAIAAGNAALLKLPEQTPATSALLAKLVPRYLDPELYAVVNGAVEVNKVILALRWDHIFYTGSGRVGKIVAQAAAAHLTPVSLELGGKNPAIVDPKCDVRVAARRILWGRFTNAGQICTAIDYVLVPREFQDKLVDALLLEYAKAYSQDANARTSIGRLVSNASFARIKALLERTRGLVVAGGLEHIDEADKWIAPTVVRDVQLDDSLMEDEIFGPVLAIVPVDDVDAAIAYVNSRDHPLALYVFSQDKKFKAKVFDNTQSGGAFANESILHAAVDGLPFGGVGGSGSGYHRGKFGFDTFTHLRASYDAPNWMDYILGVRFAPYTTKNMNFLARLTAERLPARGSDGSEGSRKWVLFALATIAAATAVSSGKLRGLIGA
ncbi:hypothetical protein PLICRDRAFT_58530 [Plicaturopsis crispa FD-325 SS-3]|uniref:Aldehyde dehydrogenase n=1 Tax=Plicaturopsis crispa FD-325 SS-3 TaxID=944288 RepID=A0A0C9SK71_PLICR|nr:hypothetical protein PLICRDRAFT_58530 [Plicaturopsis crispa FD-325 SS-3]